MQEHRRGSANSLTIADVAEELGVSIPTVERLVSAGSLASVKVANKSRRILRRDLDAFIEARRTVAA
jgi:excisionase family DNA binding protein